MTLYHWDLPQGLLQPEHGKYGWYSVEADGGTLRGLSGTPDYVAPEVLSWCAARATPPRNSAAQFFVGAQFGAFLRRGASSTDTRR